MTSPLFLHEVAESSHRILNGSSLQKMMLVADVVGLGPTSSVLDIGCGKGELLAQWSAAHGCRGHGIDASEVFLSAARERVVELGVADRLSFTHGDAEHLTTAEEFDVVCCIGVSWFAGGLEASLRRMVGWTAPGGTLVLGEPFWRTDPQPGWNAGWDQRFHTAAGLLEVFDGLGLELVEMVGSNQDDWDRYCAAQWRNLHDWLLAHPDDERREAVRGFLDIHRRRFLEVQREHLGWAMWVLRPVRP